MHVIITKDMNELDGKMLAVGCTGHTHSRWVGWRMGDYLKKKIHSPPCMCVAYAEAGLYSQHGSKWCLIFNIPLKLHNCNFKQTSKVHQFSMIGENVGDFVLKFYKLQFHYCLSTQFRTKWYVMLMCHYNKSNYCRRIWKTESWPTIMLTCYWWKFW